MKKLILIFLMLIGSINISYSLPSVVDDFNNNHSNYRIVETGGIYFIHECPTTNCTATHFIIDYAFNFEDAVQLVYNIEPDQTITVPMNIYEEVDNPHITTEETESELPDEWIEDIVDHEFDVYTINLNGETIELHENGDGTITYENEILNIENNIIIHNGVEYNVEVDGNNINLTVIEDTPAPTPEDDNGEGITPLPEKEIPSYIKKESKADKVVDKITDTIKKVNSPSDIQDVVDKYGNIYVTFPEIQLDNGSSITVRSKRERGEQTSEVIWSSGPININCFFNKKFCGAYK